MDSLLPWTWSLVDCPSPQGQWQRGRDPAPIQDCERHGGWRRRGKQHRPWPAQERMGWGWGCIPQGLGLPAPGLSWDAGPLRLTCPRTHVRQAHFRAFFLLLFLLPEFSLGQAPPSPHTHLPGSSDTSHLSGSSLWAHCRLSGVCRGGSNRGRSHSKEWDDYRESSPEGREKAGESSKQPLFLLLLLLRELIKGQQPTVQVSVGPHTPGQARQSLLGRGLHGGGEVPGRDTSNILSPGPVISLWDDSKTVIL